MSLTLASVTGFQSRAKRVPEGLHPAWDVAVLPGYTLERATCGIFKAALHQVVS